MGNLTLGSAAVEWQKLVGLCCAFLSSVSQATDVRWPGKFFGSDTYRESAECRDFWDLAVRSSNRPSSMRTDALWVLKNGEFVAGYTDGVYNTTSKHALWSASKTVTATLVGAAVQQSLVTLDDVLSERVPRPSSLVQKNMSQDSYNSIRLRDLLQMGAGMDWNESYEGDPKTSSIIEMLYLKGYLDSVAYSSSKPMVTEGPGGRWIYSGANSNLLMAYLRSVVGDERYSALPQNLLFQPLQLNDVVFERDLKKNFLASSYVHMNIRDFARLGQLYLQRGAWNGRQILPEWWADQAQTVSPPVLREATPREYILQEGVFSSGAFWLNQDVRGLGLPFPHSPTDMYFAAGHYGQLLFVIPSEGLVVARFGHDAEYWGRIDAFASRAVACFSKKGAVAPIPESKPPLDRMTKDLVLHAIKSGMLNGIFAKEMCSCRFVAGLPMDVCMARTNLPGAERAVRVVEMGKKPEIQVITSLGGVVYAGGSGGPRAHASFNPHEPDFGCGLNLGAGNSRR